MKYTERLIYKNANGDSVEISYFSPYTPTALTESLDADVTTSKNNLQDGEKYISGSLEARAITIAGFFLLDTTDTLERRLKRVFNPKLSGKLYLSDGKTEKYIDVRVDSLPEIRRQKRMAQFNIDLTAYNPYWRETERTEYIALLSPKFHFPLDSRKGQGFVFGLHRSTLSSIVDNVGDTACGFRVVFRAKGSVLNPSVINRQTGEAIMIKYQMDKGDVIEVVNEVNRKMIYINGVRDFTILDRPNTSFYVLEPGENVLGYNADENVVNLDVMLYYSPLYL